MTWEESQEECSWCGDQTIVVMVDPLALCHECYQRYREKYPNEFKDTNLWLCPKCGYERRLIKIVPGCTCDVFGCDTHMVLKPIGQQ